MLTPFGITIRKLRLDRGMRLLDLADKLRRSAAFVSAVETGKSPIPEGYVDEVARAMVLSSADAFALQRAADETTPVVRVHSLPAAQREFVAAFARGVDKLPADLAEQIRKVIYKSRLLT